MTSSRQRVFRGPQGDLLIPGRTEQRVAFYPAWSSTLPAWLSTQSGTYTGTSVTAGSASARAAWASTAAGGTARFQTAFDIVPMNYDAVIMRIKGLRFNNDAGWNARFGFSDVSYNRGVSINHDNSGTTESNATIQGHIPSLPANVHAHPNIPPYQLQKPFGGSRSARDMTLIWLPGGNKFYVCEEDQVMVAVDLDPAVQAAMTVAGVKQGVRALGAVFPTGSTTEGFAFSGIELAVRHSD